MSKNCQKIAILKKIAENCNFFRKIVNGNFFEKNENFWQFFWEKMSSFWQFFDSQMAISGGSGMKSDTISYRYVAVSQTGIKI